MVVMRLLARCSAGNRPVSFGKRHRPEAKRNYAFDKKIYRKKIQSALFARHDKDVTLKVMQDLIDITQYFMDEGILYDVLTEMEDDLFFYEVCTWYRKIRG